MSIALWIYGVIVANMVLGATVWAAIDHEDQRFYRWYAACPPQISWLLQPLVLMAWPVGLWLRLKGQA
jgi:hypothetical protein